MKLIKAISAALCLCFTAALWCGCETGSEGENAVSVTSEPTVMESTSEEEISQTAAPQAVSTSEITTAEPEEPKAKVYFIYEDSDKFRLRKDYIEETEDTVFAMDFAKECIESEIRSDMSILDLDKYMDNIYLKEYIKDNLNRRVEHNVSDTEIEYNIYIHPVWIEERDGINYVYIGGQQYTRLTQEERKIWNVEERDNTRVAHGYTVGIRDGKIVNVLGNSIYPLQYYIYGKTPLKAGDSINYPNVWDDEQLAQRVVNAFKKYASGEYQLFADAWESEGE